MDLHHFPQGFLTRRCSHKCLGWRALIKYGSPRRQIYALLRGNMMYNVGITKIQRVHKSLRIFFLFSSLSLFCFFPSLNGMGYGLLWVWCCHCSIGSNFDYICCNINITYHSSFLVREHSSHLHRLRWVFLWLGCQLDYCQQYLFVCHSSKSSCWPWYHTIIWMWRLLHRNPLWASKAVSPYEAQLVKANKITSESTVNITKVVKVFKSFFDKIKIC